MRITEAKLRKMMEDTHKMKTKLASYSVAINSMCANPKGGDMPLVAELREASAQLDDAKGALNRASIHLGEAKKFRKRRGT